MNRDMTERIAWFATATEGGGHAALLFILRQKRNSRLYIAILPGKAGNGNFPGAD